MEYVCWGLGAILDKMVKESFLVRLTFEQSEKCNEEVGYADICGCVCGGGGWVK